MEAKLWIWGTILPDFWPAHSSISNGLRTSSEPLHNKFEPCQQLKESYRVVDWYSNDHVIVQAEASAPDSYEQTAVSSQVVADSCKQTAMTML